MRTALHDDGLFERLFSAASEADRAAGVELYERRGRSLELTEGEAGLRVTASEERGLSLRLFKAGRVGFAAASPAGASRLPATAAELLPRARVRRGARPPAPAHGEPQEAPATEPEALPHEAELLERLSAFRRSLADAGKGAVVLREASILAGTRHERIATSAGRRCSFSASAASLTATVVGRAGSARSSARVVAAASRLSALPVARLARLATDRVVLPLTGRRLAPGRYDVLLDPHVAAHLVGRLSPLFLGGEEEERLRARTRDGREAFASRAVSIVDAAGAPGGPVATTHDGEGTPQGRTVLVDRGRVVGRLTDVAWAARLGAPATGNAVRHSWSQPPEVGVTNVFLDPSAGVSPVELLGGVTRGVYAAVLLERPGIDLASDLFRLTAAGYALEKGRAQDRVSEVVVTGRLSEFLRAVAAIGDDLKFAAGAGGGVGSPTLLVPRWKID